MVMGKNDNHKDHDLAFTTLLQGARRHNVKLNYDKLKFKCTEVNFYCENYKTDGCKPAQNKVTAIVEMPPPSSKKRGTVFHRNGQLLNKIFAKAYRVIQANQGIDQRKSTFHLGAQSTKNHSTCLRRK